MTKQQNDFSKGSIPKTILTLAAPMTLAQLINVLYSVVDRMYLGRLPGHLALTGLGLTMPIISILMGFANLCGMGGAPLMSMRMGEGETEQARRILANCFLMLCVLSVALMALLAPIREPMLMLFGASEATFPFAGAYFSAYLCGTPFALLSTGMCQFIICQGFAGQAMLSVVLGAVMNIVLDPVFIFALDMGVRGGALATVFSQMASCAYAVWFLLFSRRAPVSITFGGYSLRVMGRVLALGFSPFLIIAMDNVMIIAMNAVLQNYGGPAEGDLLVTCATIVQSFMLIVTMPLGGITGGTQTILAFNYGAHRPDRVKKAQRYIFMLAVGYTTLLFILARTAGPLFVRLFTSDSVLAAEAFQFIRICTLAVIPLGVQYVIVDGFTGIGQVRLSLPLSFFRKLVYFVSLFVLPALWGARTAFYAEPLSDLFGPLASVIVYSVAMKKILKKPVLPPV